MLTIQVDGSLELRLKALAASSGSEPQTVAARVLEEHLPKPDQATIDLLTKWEKDESSTDPAELARRQFEGEQFMRNLADNRLAGDGPNARKLWP